MKALRAAMANIGYAGEAKFRTLHAYQQPWGELAFHLDLQARLGDIEALGRDVDRIAVRRSPVELDPARKRVADVTTLFGCGHDRSGRVQESYQVRCQPEQKFRVIRK